MYTYWRSIYEWYNHGVKREGGMVWKKQEDKEQEIKIKDLVKSLEAKKSATEQFLQIAIKQYN